MKTIKIDRKLWYRGKGTRHSKFLLTDGTGCCLGNISMACGVPKERLTKDVCNPQVLFSKNHRDYPKELNFLIDKRYEGFIDDTEEARKLMQANDEPETTDAQKEIYIKKVFKQRGMLIKFIN